MQIPSIFELVDHAEPGHFPEKAHPLDSGFDMFAKLDSPLMLETGQRALIDCGFRLNMPSPHELNAGVTADKPEVVLEAQVRSRSGLASKRGLFVLNSPGTIDNTYTGNVKVVLCNLGEAQVITSGMKIAQLVFQFVPFIDDLSCEYKDLDNHSRLGNGFGSTGQ